MDTLYCFWSITLEEACYCVVALVYNIMPNTVLNIWKINLLHETTFCQYTALQANPVCQACKGLLAAANLSDS